MDEKIDKLIDKLIEISYEPCHNMPCPKEISTCRECIIRTLVNKRLIKLEEIPK